MRNETITTPPRSGSTSVPKKSGQAAAQGLFIVQFERPIGSQERAELRSLGVQLLKYVPEDAFIARFRNVTADRLSSLQNVRWFGPYRPDHKLHHRLVTGLAKALPADDPVEINILMPADATPAEVAHVRGLLASVQHQSHLRQGTILRATIRPGVLHALANSPAVLWLEPAPKRRLVDEFASKVVGGDDGQAGTPTLTQQLGFNGAGVTVSVADTGVDSGRAETMHPDLFGRVSGFRFYGDLFEAADEYGHGTHVAGTIAANAATGEKDPDTGGFFGLGVASGSSLFVQRIFDQDGFEVNPFPSDEELTRDAVRAGAHIGSNSWGTDNQGEYDTDSSQFDELVRDADANTPGDQPYILVFAAGNSGPSSQTLYSPASGKNVLSVGASQNVPGTLALTYGLYADGPDAMADFSSRGPCQDGRLKPDVVAPGTWISSLASSAAYDLASVAWMTNDQYYVYMGGTSMACPHGAGAAAIFVQYYKSLHGNSLPSPALVKAALINSSTPLDLPSGGPAPIPNHEEGWGRLNLAQLIVTNRNTADRYFDFLDQAILMTNVQVYTRHALVESSEEPLKITLAYTDVAGFAGAIPALVNDLDLEVVAPDGTLYRGNQFSAGFSIPNAPLADNLNNVESVHIAQPTAGDYTIRVRGRSIIEDARLDTATVDQDFALVISGAVTRPGTGAILLDRPAYTAPGSVKLQVLDPSRSGSSSVSVVLKSTSEPAGENLTLQSSGSYGAFTGTVATIVGNAAPDGRLQIHHGDTIEATYLDSSSNLRTAAAAADLVPPQITGVGTSFDLGVLTVHWQTSEAANSVVRYATNLTLNLAVTNSELTTSHSIRLRNLVPGRPYYFSVSSSDAAGNTATNDNSGTYFNFVAVPVPVVLFVDAFEEASDDDDWGWPINAKSYTNTLPATGYTFATWKVPERGSPQLADLQPFQVVIWQTTDDIVYYTGTNNTLSAAQQFMIQSYLEGGGSFLMTSMSILSQLGDVPFRRNVLQVARFVQNPGFPYSCPTCDEFVGVPAVVGTAASPITTGVNSVLNYSSYPSFDLFGEEMFGPDFGSTFSPGTNATPILFEPNSGKICGISYPRPGFESPGRVVFLSFPLDTMPPAGPDPNSEAALLRNILKFLAPGANGIGTLLLDSAMYSIPDRITVELGDSDLAGAGQAQVTFTTSSATNRATVNLAETSHPGLFRGYLTVVAANPDPDQLPVANGGTITAQYFDASNQSNVVTSARLDTVPPVITQVSTVTGFGDAVITWTTSKPADSLVQYGGSGSLDRTVYQQQFVTNHALLVSGLTANRTYYFRLTSRDEAGNTTVDDNNGQLYSFQTRKAPQPPWFDDLENGGVGWTVVPDPVNGSDRNWELGTPNNGLQTAAVSGTNAWGSNLKGLPFSLLASSFLLSPMIDLSGFSEATLSFWHCYDFSGSTGFEEGQMLVSTNSGASFSSLPVLMDFSGFAATDWEHEVLDLTPWVGHTIQVIWQFQGVDIGSRVYGWLVDDVEITGVSAGQSGTIVVTKNLGQGSFTLSGATSHSGTGLLTTITNAPPGQYSIQFSDVAFYQTPPPQTSVLAPTRTLAFSGNYTFIDGNRNGMSDAWEQFYFGSTWSNRTQSTDWDVDGLTDYGEFMAGTNPTNAASRLVILSVQPQPGNAVQLQWASIPGRVYQVQTSGNLESWLPVSDWVRATGSPLTHTVINPASGPWYYRIQVRP